MKKKEALARFLQSLVAGRYADAERALEVLRKKITKKGDWGLGYLTALEGFLGAKRSGDQNAFMINLGEDLKELRALRREFSSHVKLSSHADYDKGFFAALRDLVSTALELRRQGSQQRNTV